MDGRSYSNRRLKMVLNLDGNPIPLREKGKTKVAFADSGYEAFRKKSQTIEEVRKSIQYVLSMLKENKQVKSALREEIEQEFNQEERGSIGDDIEIFEKYINRLAEGAPLRLATAYEYAKAKDITFYVMTKNEKKRYYLNRQFSHLHAAEVNGNEKEKEKEKEKENSGEKDLVEEIVYVAWTGEQLVGMEANVPQQMQTIILEDDAMEMVPLEDDHDDEKRKDETEIPSLQEAYFNGTDINPFLTAKYERMMKIIREKSANLHEILKLDLDKELEDHGDMVDLDVTHQADSLFKRKNVVLQKNGLARVLCDTLKMEGEKRYFDFILLLINEKSQELKKLASQQLMRRFDQEEDVSVLLSLHLIAEAQYALLSMVYRVLENGFSSNEAYQDAVLQGIHGGSGVKAEMQERFLTHISRFINTYLVEKGGLTEKQAQERIRREMDRVNTYLDEFWSASNTQFPNEFVIEDIRSTEQKLEWREGCKQRMLVRKKESIRGWYFYELNILGRDKMEDNERQGLTQRYNKIKEESAQRLWRKRHSMMPKCLLQAWGSEQEFKTAVIREHVDTDYKEEITGNNLALLSIKYNNHLVYQYLIKRSSLPDEELCRHNAKGLSLSDYRALLLKNKDQGTYERARVKIDSAEPDHDFLLELEKLLRKYLDQWHGRKHKREIHEDSNNPFLQLENLFTQLRE